MTTVDTPVPPASDTLLGRMMVLAGVIDRIKPGQTRSLLLNQFPRPMLLFSRMLERLGIAAPETPWSRAVLREAELGCLQCTAWHRCLRWPDGRAPDDDYVDFCPNEGLLSVLPRQDNVKRPYCPE